ncbi:hypothetical protein EVAR_15694_1 [Eumeta japonica]|uniref:Uncharacterized protein n=1 Tax=Eumeta variegata TaxID=151549 RepID=A0A4C1UA84_EUMVA|nr:hypothetical protein EVAR_15694_1 [Eumeta japonica]
MAHSPSTPSMNLFSPLDVLISPKRPATHWNPLEVRVFMGGGDHLLFDGSPARLPLLYAINKTNVILVVHVEDTSLWTHNILLSHKGAPSVTVDVGAWEGRGGVSENYDLSGARALPYRTASTSNFSIPLIEFL